MTGLLAEQSLPAPDLAGTIDAWRVWRVVRRGGVYLLGSLIMPTVWPQREPLLAKCLRDRSRVLEWLRGKNQHAAPTPRCGCGVYAVPDLAQIRQYLTESSMQPAIGRVVGQVALWGKVVECERGFRASHAYPQRIVVLSEACGRPDRAEDLVQGLAAYGVPVARLDAPPSETMEELAQWAA